LERDRQYVKEDGKKVTARRAGLDQAEAFLKTEKEKHNDSEKNLNAFASLLEKRDVQSLKDSTDLRKEGERLANISKVLDAKKLDFDKADKSLKEYSNALELKEKDLKADLKEVEELKAIWQDKVNEAETSKKQYSEAYAGLAQKEKEVEIARLRLIKIGKEKITEETLRQLEKEANV